MIKNDGIFNAEGNLWTSLVESPVRKRANLGVRSNVKLDHIAQDLV